MIGSGYSFRLLSRAKLKEIYPEIKKFEPTFEAKTAPVQDHSVESDSKKRSFLKLAGVVGAGVVATQLLPRKAEALVFGSTPASNTVGVKNIANARVNPATQETLAAIKAQSDLLTFDSGSNPANLKVNVAAGDVGILNVANTAINPATEETLASIKSKTDLLTFTGDSLKTAGGSSASATGINDTTSTQVNPATEESITYLRRMVKLMESQATVDFANRQRITLDSIGPATAIGTTVPVSGTVTVGTISTVTSVTNMVTMAGQNQQMFQDVARNTFANGVRQNLSFS